MILINKSLVIASCSKAAVLILLCASCAVLCKSAFAQSNTAIDQPESPATKSTGANRAFNSGEPIPPDDDAPTLSGFFKVGIVINIIIMVAFAFWFVSQWKKHNKNKTGAKQ